MTNYDALLVKALDGMLTKTVPIEIDLTVPMPEVLSKLLSEYCEATFAQLDNGETMVMMYDFKLEENGGFRPLWQALYGLGLIGYDSCILKDQYKGKVRLETTMPMVELFKSHLRRPGYQETSGEWWAFPFKILPLSMSPLTRYVMAYMPSEVFDAALLPDL